MYVEYVGPKPNAPKRMTTTYPYSHDLTRRNCQTLVVNMDIPSSRRPVSLTEYSIYSYITSARKQMVRLDGAFLLKATVLQMKRKKRTREHPSY